MQHEVSPSSLNAATIIHLCVDTRAIIPRNTLDRKFPTLTNAGNLARPETVPQNPSASNSVHTLHRENGSQGILLRSRLFLFPRAKWKLKGPRAPARGAAIFSFSPALHGRAASPVFRVEGRPRKGGDLTGETLDGRGATLEWEVIE